jgi:hypothetical protein
MVTLRRSLTLAAGLAILATTGILVSSPEAIAEKIDSVQIVGPLPLPVNAQISSSVPLSVNANVISSVPIVATVPPPPQQTPFQTNVYIYIDEGTTGNLASFDVPAGKRLVIESIAGSLFLATGQTVRVASIRTDYTGTGFPLVVSPVPNQTDSVTIFTHAIKLYATQNVEFAVYRTGSTGTGFCTFAVSGYLVDL